MLRISFLIMTFLLCSNGKAQVVINELGIAPSAGSLEFIELYNKNSCSVDLSCYTLVFSGTSGGGNPTGWTIKIPSGKSIPACGYFFIGGVAGSAGMAGGTGYPTGGVVTSYPSADVNVGTIAFTANAVYMRQGVNAGTLPNSSGQITLLNDAGVVIASVSYNNGNNPGSYPLSAYTTCNAAANSQGGNNIFNPGASANNVNAAFAAAGNQGIYLDAAGNYIASTNLSPGAANPSQSGCAPGIILPITSDVCFSANAQITLLNYSGTTNSPTTYSIIWDAIPANGFGNIVNATLPAGPITINIPAGTIAATYTGNITVSNASGTSCNTPFTLTIKPLPVINAGTYSPVCAGGGVIPLTASPAGGSFTGLGVSGNIFTVPTIPGNYTVLYSYTFPPTGCINAASATITVNPLPVIAISGNTRVCFGNSTTLNASGGSMYGWSPATGLSSATGVSVIANPLSTTVYTVTGTDVNSCTNAASVTIDVDSMSLTAPLINTVQPGCTTATGSITINAPVANAYQYSIDGMNYQPSNFFPNLTGGSYSVTVRNGYGCTSSPVVIDIVSITSPLIQSIDTAACESLMYNGITYTTSAIINDTLKNQSGCDSVVRTINIQINPRPQLNVSADHIICSGSSTTLTASAFNVFVQWLGFGAGNSITVTPGITTTYAAVATSANGCSDTAFTTVTVSDFYLTLFASPNSVISGMTSSLFTTANSSYQIIGWKPATIFHNQFASSQSLITDSSLLITVVARSNSGCIDSASVIITVNPLNDLFIPNAFTPNGDGKNDVFRVLGEKIQKFDMKIYNRWGQLIFSSNERLKGWDGNFAGKHQPTGNYVYVLKATLQNGNTINKKGTILLIK